MRIEEFSLERIQSLYENTVEFNLSDSGVHPMPLNELLSENEIRTMCGLELGYGWTNGSEELRGAIAHLYRNRKQDHVLVTNGSAEANFLLAMTLVEPGDEVIVIVPNYLQIYGFAKAMGATVRTVKLNPDAEWSLNIDEIAAAISDRTKLITICNPNNPTGAVLSLDQMQEIVALMRKHDLYLHADEVYKGANLLGEDTPSFADLYEKAIASNGLSKAMAMPGLRLGWLVGPQELMEAAWCRKDYTSITTSTLSEYIGSLVLQPKRRQSILDRSKSMLRENLSVLGDWIEANSDNFSYGPPKAGGMAYIRYRLDGNSTELAHELRREKSVLVLPGDVYGMDGYVRVGIGTPKEHLAAGLDRFADLLRERA